mgnify:CR=1 FL=1
MLQMLEQHVHEEPLIMDKKKSMPNNIDFLKSALAGEEETTPESNNSQHSNNSEEIRRESLNNYVKGVIAHEPISSDLVTEEEWQILLAA